LETAFELSEKDGQFQLEAAIAGVEAKDIEIKVTPEHIVLTAILNTGTTAERHDSLLRVRNRQDFRSIHLPRKIDTDKVKAEFKNGLLRLTAEIAEEARGKKRKRQAA